MKSLWQKVLGILAATTLLSSCATIVSSTKHDVKFTSAPSGAKVIIDKKEYGKTPLMLTLPRKGRQKDEEKSKKSYALQFELEGYNSYETTINREFNPWFLGNIMLGGVIGMVVDASNGAMYKLTPEHAHATLIQSSTASTLRQSNDENKNEVVTKVEPIKPKEVATKSYNKTPTPIKQYNSGIQINANSNWWRVKNRDLYSDTQFKNAFGLGIQFFGDQQLSNDWQLHLELGWLQRGGKLEETIDNSFTSKKVTATGVFQFLHLALSPQYTVTRLEKADIFLSGGLWAGYALSGKTTTKTYNYNTKATVSSNSKVDFKNDNVNQADFGLQFGAGVRVFKNVTAELRYSLGFGYADKNDKETSFRNNAIGLTVGYAFQ